MTDFLGPASDTFATTTRPADSRTFGTSNTWFKDCSGSTADDGTEISAEFLNSLIAQLRTVITNSGIAISPTDDTLLYAAIQNLITSGGTNGAWATVASSATIDLGAQSSRNLIISGTTAITSFGATGDTKYKGYRIQFSGALTLTNSASLVLPTGANITTAAGDIALAIYMGGGIWAVVDYNRADGTPLVLKANSVTPAKMALGAWATVASAATVDLGAQTSRNIVISGTTTITSFGATPVPDNMPFLVRFSGVLTLTYNAGSLILPGSANITTASGDVATVVCDSTGIWRVFDYSKADGTVLTAITQPSTDNSTHPATTAWVNNVSLGISQTWQNVTSSRMFSTTYYNTTGRPIAVNVAAQSTNANTGITVSINGIFSGQSGANFSNASLNLFFIVPPNASYAVSVTNASLSTWAELK